MTIATTTAQNSDTARSDAPVVVVGYDGSPESRQAVVLAGERAGPAGTVVPVHVAPHVSSWLGTPYYDRAVEAHHLAATRMLAELDELETGPATVEPDIIEGSDPAHALMRVAEVRDADEIVVGSRARGRFRAMLGSVSHELIERADRPVVIVARGAVDDNH